MTAPALAVRANKFPWWIYWTILVVLIVLSWAPLGSAYYGEYLAHQNNCDVNGTTPCVTPDGKDIGPLLYDLQVYPYMMVFTMPGGFILGFVWLVVLVVHRVLWGRRAEASA